MRWLDAGGRPTPLAQQAVGLLQEAASQGLDPADYEGAALAKALQSSPASEAPGLDAALNRAMLRYLSDVHRGRVDPLRIHHNFRLQHPDAFDAALVLEQAVAQQDLRLAVTAAVPRFPLYDHLRRVLAQYRTLQGHPAWAQALPPVPKPPKPARATKPTPAHPGGAGKAEPGQPYAGLPLLVQRLQALGDLDPAAPVPTQLDGAVVDALRRFQTRHGLSPDGVLGKGTLAQLAVPPEARVRQIELGLERLRWTPLMQSRRMILVNLPEFVLRAYEVQDNGRVQLRHEMKVVVGKALDTRTPLFDEDMRFIEFSPYWNVPSSIARKELVPKLRRQPAYFEEQGFEFVAGDGSVHTGLSSARLDAVMAGQMRIRQRPGPLNALGDIKFVFPNRDNIYLHHTPATALFARDRRDFSHGCIRVEQPVALAEFVLQGMPDWDQARIREAMEKGKSNTLRLTEPIPVLIAYGTTLVKNGLTYFYADIYGHDRVLDAALRARPRPVSVFQRGP
ncbi:MAG TPA: L,D-transpeptidase family protein [Macromonas sp.]|nr:L,D-transpeptidase family protein [Macromonas sp.]